MTYKFEKLEVWQLAVEYIDMIYKIAELLEMKSIIYVAKLSVPLLRLRSISPRDRPGKVMLSRTVFWGWRCDH
jgi:hypothetical protein